MRRLTTALTAVLLLGLASAKPHELRAQQRNIPAALAGGFVGAASGGYIAISVIVAESRAGKYIHSMKDALGWRSAPVLIGGVTGMVVGATDPDRLLRTVVYGSAGTVAGTGVGVVLGKIIWDGPEAKWAGGAIGAGLGMAIGSSLGLFLPLDHSDGTSQPAANAGAARIPITFTIRF
ncbi:MAG: hypothetical protein ABIV28_02530 [Longimicrobiales bacterium]